MNSKSPSFSIIDTTYAYVVSMARATVRARDPDPSLARPPSKLHIDTMVT